MNTAGLPGAGADISNEPRFQALLTTPFVQALQGLPRPTGQGVGSDTALSLPNVKEIPFSTFKGFHPDEQAATRWLYPGLTESAFQSPFLQAVSSLPRVSTATRYA